MRQLSIPALAGQSSAVSLRPDVAQSARIAPGRNRSLDQLKADGGYSDRAKLTAQAHEDRCRRPDQWLTWPHASTTAADNGWDATEHGGRKKVQRGNRELIDGGDLVKLRLGELAGWFDAHGAALGLAWPEKLPRWRKGLWVTVLRWRIPEPARPGACDGSVAPGKDGQGTPALESHHLGGGCRTRPDRSVALGPTEVSHPMENVRTEPQRETTSVPDDDGSADAPEEGRSDGEATMPAVWTPYERAAGEVKKFRATGRDLEIEVNPDGSESIRPVLTVANPPPVEPETLAKLKALKPSVLAYLRGEPDPDRRRPTAAAPERPKRLAPVDPEAAKLVRDLVAGLPRDRDPKAAEAVGDALCVALRDRGEESPATFRGYAERVRRGRMSPEALLDAFGVACSATTRNRGARLVREVNGPGAVASGGRGGPIGIDYPRERA